MVLTYSPHKPWWFPKGWEVTVQQEADVNLRINYLNNVERTHDLESMVLIGVHASFLKETETERRVWSPL